MDAASTAHPRVHVDGKFFRLGNAKFYLKGIAYGPFPLNPQREEWPSPEQTKRDFALVRELHANGLRVFQPPPRWFLDLAAEHDLKLLVDAPWAKHRCFLDSEKLRREARGAVEQAARACIGHSAVLALNVANEIPADIVRWSGPRAVAEFIDDLVEVAKSVDSDCLCTFGNLWETEFLQPQGVDFVAFSVGLKERRLFEIGLAQRQLVAGQKPLVLGDVRVDVRPGVEAQAGEVLSWQIDAAFRGGLAGVVVHSFTAQAVAVGQGIQAWHGGLTTRERKPRDSFGAVQKAFQRAPYFPLSRPPKVSVVVASGHGGPTLKACLDSLVHLNYPDYEIILVDDGSTDTTPEIAELFKTVRYFRQEERGSAAARNTGVAAAEGEIVAFTDADCRAECDWLYYLVSHWVDSPFTGVGGPSLWLPDNSPVAAVIKAAPGEPTPVLRHDLEAEQILGCNMAFHKRALEEIGGFAPAFPNAGGDIDLCWRLRQRGFRIGFCPSAFVWQDRRFTVKDYFQRQRGYGQADALLAQSHPQLFKSPDGNWPPGQLPVGSAWGACGPRLQPPDGFWENLFAGEWAALLPLLTTLEFHALVTVPLCVLAAPFRPLRPIAIAVLLVSLGVCVTRAMLMNLPKRARKRSSRALLALLFFLQPMVRGLARYRERLNPEPPSAEARAKLDMLATQGTAKADEQACYWAESNVERAEWLKNILSELRRQGLSGNAGSEGSGYDLEIHGSRWSRLELSTVGESYAGDKKMFRCRLRARWSLRAKVTLAAVLGLDLLVVGFVGPERAWIWLLLATVPTLGWYLEQEKRNLQWLLAGFLDDVAKRSKLTKLRYDESGERFEPVGGPKREM